MDWKSKKRRKKKKKTKNGKYLQVEKIWNETFFIGQHMRNVGVSWLWWRYWKCLRFESLWERNLNKSEMKLSYEDLRIGWQHKMMLRVSIVRVWTWLWRWYCERIRFESYHSRKNAWINGMCKHALTYTGSTRYKQSFHLWFCVNAIEIVAFQRNVSSSL